jgi:hypothetical protein
MTSKHHETISKAPLYLGHHSQLTKALEELAELQLILARYNHEPARYLSAEPIIDEIADVAIMNHQLACMFGYAAVSERIDFKIERLKKLIDNS